MKLKAKHFAWVYLLKEGGVGEWSFYGSSWDFDKQLTNLAYRDILAHGIDWNKTKAPTDSYESSFIGTDCEETDKHQTMEGVLVTGNGVKYKFGCTFESGNIFKVMESVIEFDSVEVFGVEKLLKEL